MMTRFALALGRSSRQPAALSDETLVALLGAFRDGLKRETSAISGALAQMRRLLHQSVNQLRDGFMLLEQTSSGLTSVVGGLNALMGREITSIGAESSVSDLINETRRVTTELAGRIGEMADRAETSQKQLADMVEHADAVFVLLSRIDGIAKQTRLLSLNASIEAARAHGQGQGFGTVASEVRQLAKASVELSQAIGERIGNTRQAIRCVRGVVDEIAGQHVPAAMSARGAVDESMQRLNELLERSLAAGIDQLGTATRDLPTTVAETIRSLQFDDLVLQIIGDIEKRMAHGQRVVEQLDSAIAKVQSGGGADEAVNEAIAAIGELYASQPASSVSQQSMAAGSIELF